MRGAVYGVVERLGEEGLPEHVVGAGVGLAFYPAESALIFPAMVLAGALGGFLWAMIPALLKVKFGTNEILVFGRTGQVATEIRRVIDLLDGPKGGYLMAPTNSIMPDTPLENIEIMYRTAREYGREKRRASA